MTRAAKSSESACSFVPNPSPPQRRLRPILRKSNAVCFDDGDIQTEQVIKRCTN